MPAGAIPNFDDFIKQPLPPAPASAAASPTTIPAFDDFVRQQNPPSVPGAPGGQPPSPPKPPLPYALQSDEQQGNPFWNSPNGWLAEGTRKVIGGIEHMAEPGLDPKFAGASQVIRGAGEATLPVTIPLAAATAPVAAIVGAAAAIPTQYGVEKGSQALGATPGEAALYGDLAGIGVGGLAAARVSNAGNPFAVDPRVAAIRVLKPTPSDPTFARDLPQTLKGILDANGGEAPDGITNGTLDLRGAAQKAADNYRDALQPWIQRAAGTKISGNSIVRATADATRQMLPSEDPASQALISRAMQDYGHDFTVEQLQDRLELLNKRLNSYYNGSPTRQSAALADIPDAVIKAQRDATADALYKALDPEGAGAGPRRIQQLRSHAIDMVQAADRKTNAIIAEQPLTPFGAAMDPIKQGLRQLWPGSRSGLAYAEGSEGKSLPYLRRAFNAVKDQPSYALPQPGEELYPTGDTSRLLPAGTHKMGPVDEPITTTGSMPPEWQANIWKSVGAPRQLPAGRMQMSGSGTSVPDVMGRPDLRTGYRGGLLPSPGPAGQPPVNVLPRGPSSVQGPHYMPSSAGRPMPLPAPSEPGVPPANPYR